jgi:putative FmdB family regulatory protein
MPIFEYVCEDCQNSFEKLVGKEEEVHCPECHGGHLAKQYSSFGMSTGSSEGRYESLPQYRAGGGGCGCTPSSCGCKN